MNRLLVLFFVLNLLSCSPHVELIVFNNTGLTIDIVVHSGSGENEMLQVENGAPLAIPFRGTRSWVVRSFNWRYESSHTLPPERFEIRPVTRIASIFHLQLNRDGGVYLLDPSQPFPATEFVEQPLGYPLRPTSGPR